MIPARKKMVMFHHPKALLNLLKKNQVVPLLQEVHQKVIGVRSWKMSREEQTFF